MATNTVTWIVVAVVVLLLVILLLAFVGRGVRDRKRRAEAGRIREQSRMVRLALDDDYREFLERDGQRFDIARQHRQLRG